jgi:hypothetical protein
VESRRSGKRNRSGNAGGKPARCAAELSKLKLSNYGPGWAGTDADAEADAVDDERRGMGLDSLTPASPCLHSCMPAPNHCHRATRLHFSLSLRVQDDDGDGDGAGLLCVIRPVPC